MDAGAAARAAGLSFDVSVVQAAGRRSLAEGGLGGDVRVEAGAVRVTASASMPTVFLSVIGITRVSGRGEATATLRT